MHNLTDVEAGPLTRTGRQYLEHQRASLRNREAELKAELTTVAMILGELDGDEGWFGGDVDAPNGEAR